MKYDDILISISILFSLVVFALLKRYFNKRNVKTDNEDRKTE
jgi:hypothetical protein